MQGTYSLDRLQTKRQLHMPRKIWHMGVGVLVLILYFLSSNRSKYLWGHILVAISLSGFFLDTLRLKFSWANRLGQNLASLILRKEEISTYSGLPFYALGAAISMYFFKTDIALLSIMFLIFSDPVASFIGIKYGKTPFFQGKTLEGSLAGFCICFMVVIVYGIEANKEGTDFLWFAIISGIFGSLSEALPINIDDNLTIPIISGLGMSLLNLLLPIF